MTTTPSHKYAIQQLEVPRPPFRWGSRVLLPVSLIVGFLALFAGSLASSLTPPVTVEATPVVERPAMARQVAATQPDTSTVVAQAAGWIEADPFTVYATTLTDGTVEEVLFLEGDGVEKGQVLARLIDEDAILALRRAEAELAAAQEAWDSNIEARREKAVGEATVRETSASLALARAELDREKAFLREAERNYHRREELVSDTTISREEFDTAKAAVEAQEAQVRVVEQRINVLSATLEKREVELEAAEQHLELRTEDRRRLELARVAADEAQLRVDRLTIESPMDGAVMRRMVKPGSMVMGLSENPAMSRIAELYDPDKLQVRVDVPLADAADISVGQPASIVVEVLPDRTFDGVVTRVTNFADIQKNTLEVKVAINNPSPVLRPEMLATVRFLAIADETTTSGPSVATGLSVYPPEGSITNSQTWVVTNFDGTEGIAEQRSVELTGATKDGWEEVAEGLSPGDLVITNSSKTLQPGTRVRVTTEGGG